ncbi:MAG: hypothetical protein ACRDHU_10805 [Actinomycetota bacterium]
MAEPTSDAPDAGGESPDAPAAHEDLQRVQAERDALAKRVERLEDRPTKRRRLRRVSTAILLVLAVLLFALAVPGVWVRRTLADTDRYVATVAPLAQDEAVQEYLARTVTTQVFSALGVEDRLQSSLSSLAPRLVFLAGPMADAVRGFVQEKVQQIFASDAFASYWGRANRFVHQQVIAALRGEGEAVTVADGKVVLSLLPLVNQALQAVSSVAAELLGRQIDLPELTGEEVPVEAVARIEEALGIDLPDRFGTVTVYDSEELAAVQDAVDVAGRVLTLIIVLFLLAAAGALWASTRRRRTLVQLTTALAVVLVIERRFAIAAANGIVDEARPENQAAARAIVDQVLGTLLRYTGWLLAIALMVLLAALLSGPYPWAARLRSWAGEIAGAVTGGVRRGERAPAAAWAGAHRDALMLGGAALFVVVLLIADLSVGWFLVIALLLLAYELVVYRLGASVTSA